MQTYKIVQKSLQEFENRVSKQDTLGMSNLFIVLLQLTNVDVKDSFPPKLIIVRHEIFEEKKIFQIN